MKFAALVEKIIHIPAEVGPPGSDSRCWEPARTETALEIVEFDTIADMKRWWEQRNVSFKCRLIQYDELQAVTTIEFKSKS